MCNIGTVTHVNIFMWLILVHVCLHRRAHAVHVDSFRVNNLNSNNFHSSFSFIAIKSRYKSWSLDEVKEMTERSERNNPLKKRRNEYWIWHSMRSKALQDGYSNDI